MVIAELRELATEMGVGSTSGMRKGDLIAAIRERQGKSKRRASDDGAEALPLEGIVVSDNASSGAPAKAASQETVAKTTRTRSRAPRAQAVEVASSQNTLETTEQTSAESSQARESSDSRTVAQTGDARDGVRDSRDSSARDSNARDSNARDNGTRDSNARDGGRDNRRRRNAGRSNGEDASQVSERPNQRGDRSASRGDRNDRSDRSDRNQNNRSDNRTDNRPDNRTDNRSDSRSDNRSAVDEDNGRGSRRFRDRDQRDRRRRGSGGGRSENGPDTEVREDDVLLPVAGILDVLDNYAFVRTSGYLPGPNDVYVSLSLVRKHGLRRGDAITGAVRQPREGEQQRQKFNPLVRVDTINGLEPAEAKNRPDFTKLTPLYPNERLRLETDSSKLTTRVIDLVMPVGKGQRALIVSPPKAGKTTIMQDVANAIATNNPECHLMVVLVDERPEEVTDMQRSVKGEVIASTFDRPPSDHTSVAELSIERAKRLVEMGMDVVVLLDSITRLGRAYNLAAPTSGRILSGGVDSTALFPPKRFLGAARNIEGGGSLTIFATAMVETGSTGDTVIFEEFKGTGNAELKLDRKIAERRVFPAVDVNPSGTRKEDLLLSPDELAVTHKLHRVLHALDSQQAIDLLISRLRKTKTNMEFLMQVSKTALGNDED
jgi:transcription termination factor Rho